MNLIGSKFRLQIKLGPNCNGLVLFLFSLGGAMLKLVPCYALNFDDN